MRIGIIEAGEPPPSLVPRFGTYGAMIRRFLGAPHEFTTYRAFDGDLPENPRARDAYVISGSACGVYDRLPWIDALTAFVRAAAGHSKLVGICFGHQLMAQAFGGAVTKAPQGWGVGLHRYDVVAPAPWMDAVATEGAAAVAIAASHQDQVITRPPRSTVHAASPFTPHAMLSYADHPSISCQFHPEFSPEFARALLEARRSPRITDAQRAAGIASYDAPNDNERLACWIGRFLASDA